MWPEDLTHGDDPFNNGAFQTLRVIASRRHRALAKLSKLHGVVSRADKIISSATYMLCNNFQLSGLHNTFFEPRHHSQELPIDSMLLSVPEIHY